MKVFQKDVMIAATAYIAADNEEEAEAIFKESFGKWKDDDLPDGGPVSGAPFEMLIDSAKAGEGAATISPTITYHGAFPDSDSFDLVYDEADDG